MNQPPNAVAGFVDVKSIIKKFLEGSWICLSDPTAVNNALWMVADIKESNVLEMRSMLRRMRALEQQGLVFSRKTIKDHDLLSEILAPMMVIAISLFLGLSWGW